MQKAQSELAYELQASITKQKIKEEEMQIKVVERAQQINVQEQVTTSDFKIKLLIPSLTPQIHSQNLTCPFRVSKG